MTAVVYEIEIRHDGLNKYRHIRGRDRSVVEQKASAQIASWDEMWEKKEASRIKRESISASKEKAEKLTAAAQNELSELELILQHTLSIDDTIDWNLLKDLTKFSVDRPKPPTKAKYPPKPAGGDKKYIPRIGILDHLFSSRKLRKIEAAKESFSNDLEKHGNQVSAIDRIYLEELASFEDKICGWRKERDDFVHYQQDQHLSIDNQKDLYMDQDTEAIEEYVDLVLSKSIYSERFPKEFDIQFKKDAGILIVNYSLPYLTDLPALKSVKYVQSRDEFQESLVTDSERKRFFDSVCFQICLRTIHEIFESDSADAVNCVCFNGYVNFVDPATGRDSNSCIMTLTVEKDEFMNIELSRIQSKECFRALRGISASRLSGIAPVPPIMQIERSDDRFVQSIDVAQNIDNSSNLAAMDWEDFEHLIRQVFEQEFSANGGEVKITQASRDGGVDAIAFDPDPIRGGKIVIQAKRYTNTVGVAAVRDLYGTVVNEGATKGILVTTASYGPDAYKFAKDKPITLIDGSNLLHLLERQGIKARIDLAEAKLLLA